MEQAEFNNTFTDYSREKVLSELFEETASAFGNKTAVQYNNSYISYNELNAKANQLANYLRNQGVSVGTVVILHFERSLEFIIGLLAITKAGGLYLPVYINEAQDRYKLIIENSGSRLIITNEVGSHYLKENIDVPQQVAILNIEQFFREESEKNSENPSHINNPTDPAYVIYTSGSTGVPKGCVIPHRAVVRLVKNTNYICIKPEDIIAHMANVAFDATTFEIWGALLNGACLQVIPDVVLFSPADFCDFFHKYLISIAFVTTALFNFITKVRPESFDNLRCLLFGGEKCNIEIVKILLSRKISYKLDNLRLLHVYGPTECTTFATFFEIKDEKEIQKDVPIGKPISNTTAYILDKNLKLLKPNEIGEIYLGGEGLALGYLGDSEKMAHKFIPCPWDNTQRIYKTGDFAFWQPNNGIVFIDREDNQIKIHGFRVELSEIEACIIKYPQTQQTAAIAYKGEEAVKHLYAFVSFEKDFNNFINFYEYLKNCLPHYMLPEKVFKVDYIPLNKNGKVDQTQLLQLPSKNILELFAVNKTDNDVEEAIMSVWKNLLNINKIDVQQNIFDFGAHSLMLAEACTQLNKKLDETRKINVIDLLTYPTIKTLASYINDKQTMKTDVVEDATHRGYFRKQKRTLVRQSHNER